MASTAQLCAILDRRLGLPTGRASWHTSALRPLGYVPNAQGKATDVDPQGMAALFIACLIGSRADDAGEVVSSFMTLPPEQRGPSFGDELASHLAGTAVDPIVGLSLSLRDVGAEIRTSSYGYGIRTVYPDRRWLDEPQTRIAAINGEIIRTIAADIKAAPPTRPGRRARKDSNKP